MTRPVFARDSSRVWLVGLRKCIRPVIEECKSSGHDGDPRMSGLINGSVYDDRFFAPGSRHVGLTVPPSSSVIRCRTR